MALGQSRLRGSGAAPVGAIYSQIGVNSLDLSGPDRVRPRSVEQSYKLFEERRCMIMRRTVKAVATSGFLGFAIVGLATPSHADTAVVVSGSLTDSGAEWTGAAFTPGATFGPTLTVTITATGISSNEFYLLADGLLTDVTDPEEPRVCVARDAGSDETWCYLEEGDAHTYAVDSSASNQLVTVLANDATDRPLSGGFYVSFSQPSVAQPTVVAGPAPHIQQFPMPETGTCDEAEPEGVNWSGVASGGWGESWAQWMNDGEGGEVCTRTLIYNTSKAAWEVD